MFKFAFYLLIMPFIFAGCVHSVSPNKINQITTQGKIIDKSSNKTVSFDELIENLSRADTVLIGEKHDDITHHIAEIAIIQALNAKFKELDVVFEMFGQEDQIFIDKAKSNRKNIKKQDLKMALNWDDKWDYEMYRALMESVFYSNCRMLAGNLNQNEIEIIFKGALKLHGYHSTTKELNNALKSLISQTHQIQDNELLDKLVQIQQYKDRRMADILYRATNRAILIAGRYHAYKNLGVKLHMSDFGKKRSVVTLILDVPQNSATKDEADFVWIF